MTQNETGHSIYSPSKAHRYLRCPGSVALESTCPDKTSDYAKEGTAAHELAEKVLTKQITNASEMLNEIISWEEGHGVNKKTETWKVDHEMVDYVTRYCEEIYARMEDFGKLPGVVDVRLHVETRVDFSDLIGVADQGGTADIVIEVEFEDDSMILSVEDLKYGRGVEVTAQGNEQLKTYAAGVMADYELLGTDIRKVIVAIHQVRKHHFSEAEYDPVEIKSHVIDLKTQVNVAEIQRQRLADGAKPEELVLSPGEKQCRFCRAKHICPAARDEVAKTVFGGSAATPDEFEDLSTEAPEEVLAKEGAEALVSPAHWLAASLAQVDFIEEWCRAIRAAVHARLLDGEEVPGYKLVKGKMGNRAWKDKQEAEDTLKSMRLKQAEMYKMTVISPTQAEKLLKESPRRWKKLQDLITRKEGNPAVAPLSDKRPALEVGAVADDFDEVEDLV